jgi:hypothetical protein
MSGCSGYLSSESLNKLGGLWSWIGMGQGANGGQFGPAFGEKTIHGRDRLGEKKPQRPTLNLASVWERSGS